MNRAIVPPLSESPEINLNGPLFPPIVVGIVGKSDSGKTQLAAALIRHFKMMSGSLRVAAIKHCPHGHDADRVDSDSFRLRDAGAACVIASSPGSVTTFSTVERETELETLILQLSADYDVILVEGYKSSRIPKILLSGDISWNGAISDVVATVGLHTASSPDVPNFAGPDSAQLASWIAANPALRLSPPSVSLRVDGVSVRLKRFPSKALAGIISGFIDSLSGLPDEYDRIEIIVTPDKGTE